MSRYTDEPDMPTQHTEGFMCGHDVNDTLLELNEEEQAMYDADNVAPASGPVPEVLGDEIYDAPDAAYDDMFEEKETFVVTGLCDDINMWMEKIWSFIKSNIPIILAVLVLAYILWNYGCVSAAPMARTMVDTVSSSTGTPFRGSVSSLASNIINHL